MDAQQAGDDAISTSVKFAGALSGVVQLATSAPTVGALRAEAARLAGCSAATIKLICGGKTLQDDAKLLSEYRVGPSSRVLVTKGAGAAAALGAAQAAQQQQSANEARLEKLKAVVEKLSGRGDGRGLTDKYEFDLRNQDGTRLDLAPADRKALVAGLALHAKGQASLAAAARAARRAAVAVAAAPAAAPEEAGASAAPAAAGAEEEGAGNAGPGAEAALRQALEELLLAEEAFDLVADKQLLQAIDNVAMLLLDIVWCSYLLRDVGRLGVSAERLARARAMLARAHGPNLERLRQLHGGFSPESATYVRLEAMEGVVAFHVGDRPAAARSLRAAQERYDRLQVSPQSLAMLREMGYHTQESSRALRFCSGDVAAAVSFIAEQRAKQRERAADRKRQRAWHSERAQYGKTQRGAYVDREPLEQLVTPGYERALAAEALRAADNDMQAALDTLTDRVKAGALQLAILARQIQEAEQGPQDVRRKHVRRLTEMGFGERDARVALKEAGGSFRRAVERLAGRGGGDEEVTGGGGGAPEGGQGQQAAGERSGGGGGGEMRGGGRASRRGASGANGASGRRGGGGGGSDVSGSSLGESSAEADSEEERLERSLVDSVRGRGGGDDPTAAYDVDLEEEAEAIRRYMALLQHPLQ